MPRAGRTTVGMPPSPSHHTCSSSPPPSLCRRPSCAAEGRPFTICAWLGGIKGRYFKARKRERGGRLSLCCGPSLPLNENVSLIHSQQCPLSSLWLPPIPLRPSVRRRWQHHTRRRRRSSGQVHGRTADIECVELDLGRDPREGERCEWARSSRQTN